jgi:hypothetical protein
LKRYLSDEMPIAGLAGLVSDLFDEIALDKHALASEEIVGLAIKDIDIDEERLRHGLFLKRRRRRG